MITSEWKTVGTEGWGAPCPIVSYTNPALLYFHLPLSVLHLQAPRYKLSETELWVNSRQNVNISKWLLGVSGIEPLEEQLCSTCSPPASAGSVQAQIVQCTENESADTQGRNTALSEPQTFHQRSFFSAKPQAITGAFITPAAFDQHKTPPEGLCSARDPRALTKQMIHKSGTSAGWQLGLFWHELKTKGSSQLFPPPVPTPSYIFSLLRSEATSLEGSVPLSKSLHTRRKIS